MSGEAAAVLDGLLASLTLKATLVLALGFLLSRLLARAAATVRHSVWAATLIGLIALPAGLVAPTLPLLWLPAPGATAARGAIDPSSPATEAALDPAGAHAGVKDDSRRPDLAAATAAPARLSLGAGLRGAYFAGALAVLAHLLLGVGRVRHLTREAKPIAGDSAWEEPASEILAGLRSRLRARLLTSGSLPVPVTWGLLRPVVLLPDSLARWDRRQRRNALLHELAHVERCDWAIQTLGRVACALFWFHPLVRVAARRLGLEAERACDDRVLAAGVGSTAYAEQLLTLARRARHASRRFAAALPMAGQSQLPQRIRSVLDPRQRRSPMSRSRTLAVLILTLAPILLIGPARLVPAAGADGGSREIERDDSPLLVAVENGDTVAVEALLTAGFDVDAAIPGDGTPLIVAAAGGDLEMVRLLLDRGADVDADSPGDGNPLIVASRDGHPEIVRLLVEHGADFERVVLGDENPLIRAAGEGHLEIVRFLIDLGADVNARVLANPGEFRTPLGQARRGGHREVVDLLRAAGATE